MRQYALAFVVAVAALTAGCKTLSPSPVYLIKVDQGDTLASIATKYDTSWDKIAKLNGLAAGQSPKVGQVLRVQPGPGGLVADAGGGFIYGKGSAKRPAGVASRLPGKVKGTANADNAQGGEFQEDDFPDVERAEGGGLLYGGSVAGQSGLEWPLYGELSSLFGMRHGRYHNGIDIRARKGTTVLSAGAGTVEFAGNQHGYGKVVIVRHKTVKTLYAHLRTIDVKVGERVSHRTEIGETGMSGNSTGPHLHFEIRNLKDQAIDPLSVLEKDKLMAAVGAHKNISE